MIASQNVVDCGFNGSPPLRQWIFGTGIGYTIIGGLMLVLGIVMLLFPSILIGYAIFAYVASLFLIAWTIVGGVSLWRDGGDCYNLNYPIWAMGMAAVIISIVLSVWKIIAASASAKQGAE